MPTPRCELTSFSFEKISKLDVNSEVFKQLSEEIVTQFRDVGFIRMIEIENFDDQELLEQLKWFHKQSFNDKMKLALNRFNNNNANKYRGYMPLVGNCAVYKEQTDYGNDSIPTSDGDPLRDFMEEKSCYPNEEHAGKIRKNYQIYTKVADLILQLCAVGLGLPINHFQDMHSERHISTFRTLHYPPKNRENPRTLDDQNQIVSTPGKYPTDYSYLINHLVLEHQDGSILTLLCTFENYGLQVRDKQNKWSWVIPKRNTLIVNLGIIMENITNGELCATKHRVIDLGTFRMLFQNKE